LPLRADARVTEIVREHDSHLPWYRDEQMHRDDCRSTSEN